jgi:hypothetical protein
LLPFPPKRDRPARPPWTAIVILLGFFGFFALFQWHSKYNANTPSIGEVERLAAPRLAPDAYGRAGDLIVRAPDGVALTVVATVDIAGHRPLCGSVVDVAAERGDVTDPLIWFRTTTLDSTGALGEPGWRTPQPFTCKGGGAGVRGNGALGTGLTQEMCVTDAGSFEFTTTADTLREGSYVVDELNVGSLPVLTSHGAIVEGEVDGTFVAFGDKGVGVLLEALHVHAMRSVSRFGAEVFPAPVVLRYGESKTVSRKVRVVRGDALEAVARLSTANRVFDVTFGPNRGGEVWLRDANDVDIVRARVAASATRTFRLPPGLGDHALLRDDRGVITDTRVVLPGPGDHATIKASVALPGTLTLAYSDEAGAPLPVHVLFKGLDGTLDPRPVGAPRDGHVVKAGRSLYLLDGKTTVSLPAGRYRVTASHGPTYSLVTTELDVTAGGAANAGGVLRAVVDTSAWVAADFHLHQAPSPDSDVSLEERVQSLVCEGVELAVATDHNRITDFGPSIRTLGQEARLGTAPGVELTSAGQKWGHFNAYPMPLPSGAPEEATPVYFAKRPADMFASARQLGARVVQVNHARMDPGIGYFDQAHVDVKTGRSDGEFSSDFDAFEAFNGMWIETREKVREGPIDLVALARRGKRVTALGDSDSHKLLYEEAGYPRTFVHVPREPVPSRFARVVDALLGARDTTVTSGPFVEITVNDKRVGSIVQPTSTFVRVAVRVSAPAWVPLDRVEIWRDDTVFRTFTVEGPAKDGVRFEGELDVPLDGADRVLLAWAEADAPLPDVLPYAHARGIGFTGLVYVDTNRDGTVIVPPASE